MVHKVLNAHVWFAVVTSGYKPATASLAMQESERTTAVRYIVAILIDCGGLKCDEVLNRKASIIDYDILPDLPSL